MSIISDSSQEASNAAISSSLTPVPSPSIFAKSDLPIHLYTPSTSGHKPIPPHLDPSQKRRSSSRSIKRKKFDDELVESSLVKSSRPRSQSTFPLVSSSGMSLASPSLPSASTSFGGIVGSLVSNEATPVSLEKKKPRPASKRVKKPKSSQSHSNKDLCRWKPADDFALILSVQQTNDLDIVHRSVKFSTKFTLREVQERWYTLLYDVTTSKTGLFAIKQLSPDVINQVQSKVLFSAEEEKVIASVPSDKGSLETFQELLDCNAAVFLPSRTAKVLYQHWTLMKQYNLLQDQAVHPTVPVENVMTFSEAEDLIDDNELREPRDPVLEEEANIINRRHLRDIKEAENEVPKWQVLVTHITGVSLPDFDSKTLAVLRGRIVRYLIQSREVTFGRTAKDSTVDIDLALEGPAWKVSRRHGVIRMDNSADFFLLNEAKKPVFVDGKPIYNGNKCKLGNNAVIEIFALRFIFIINQEAITALKNRTT